MVPSQINPAKALFIKLGRNGSWEKDCIEASQTLRLGYHEVPHDLCMQSRWNDVQQFLEGVRSDVGSATRDNNQIQLFYEADQSTLWITFYGDRLYWCFAASDVEKLPDRSKIRSVLGSWKSVDINDRPLQKTQLSGALLRVQGFRGTICQVKEFDYLVRKINGVVQPDVEQVLLAQAEFEAKIATLIRKLNWKDFELLIDLLFRQAGWQRLGVLGKAEKTIDLDLFYPITNERFIVQIKSSAGERELRNFRNRIAEFEDFSRAYFIVHTPSSKLGNEKLDDVEVWQLEDIAHRVVLYGLSDWVIAKVA